MYICELVMANCFIQYFLLVIFTVMKHHRKTVEGKGDVTTASICEMV